MQTGRECLRETFLREDRAERQSAGERLRHYRDVGNRRMPLVSEQAPRAAQPALYFVGDQRCAVL